MNKDFGLSERWDFQPSMDVMQLLKKKRGGRINPAPGYLIQLLHLIGVVQMESAARPGAQEL